MPLHVAIDVRHLKDFGFGTYIRNLVTALTKVATAYQFTLIVREAHKSEFAALGQNFKLVVYDKPDGTALENILFPLFLQGLNADLVHIPLNSVPLFMPKPYVVTIHDMSSLLFADRDSLRENIRSFFFRRGLIRADKVIAVSGSTRRDVCNLLSIPANRVRRIYNAIDPVFHNTAVDAEKTKAVMERYQIDYPYLLYAGTIRPQKNVARLVEAFAVLRAELDKHRVYKNLRLIIIGDELNKYPAVRRAVIQTRMDKVVRFMGFLPVDTLRAFYSAAEAFVFPSLYEGFGLPPLEAMACGTPVIASGVSSLPEVLGDAAMIVNPENVFDIAHGIRDVLLNPELRRELVQKGYQRLKVFSWESTAQQVLKVYDEAAPERK